MPQRLAQLKSWLTNSQGLADFTLEPASGDASFRRYFRIIDQGASYIAMDAPPEKENCRPFIQVAKIFEQVGLHVPHIHAQDLEQGFLLLSDLGNTLYLDVLDPQSVDRLYGDALSALVVIQACGPRSGLPSYDRALLLQEMGLFRDWLLQGQLQLVLSAEELSQLEHVFNLLADNALEQPQVCVHRDYHSRNLLQTSPPSPGILDFQDAVIGPVTYDLASLLRDCYIAWPKSKVESWAMGYFELAAQSGILRAEDEASFLHWFDLMGIQRHLKASGIFARLNQRDNKPGYLKDIPRTLNYIVEAGANYAELDRLVELVDQRVLPLVRKFTDSMQ